MRLEEPFALAGAHGGGTKQALGTSAPLRCPSSTPDLGPICTWGDISLLRWTYMGSHILEVAVPMCCWPSRHVPTIQAASTTALLTRWHLGEELLSAGLCAG